MSTKEMDECNGVANDLCQCLGVIEKHCNCLDECIRFCQCEAPKYLIPKERMDEMRNLVSMGEYLDRSPLR